MAMTENEAINELQSNIDLPFGFTVSDEVSEIAIQALEEIKQYRAIGTVEELKSMKENGAFTGIELAQIATNQMELKKYMEIGTVEEFKALKEKNEPNRLEELEKENKEIRNKAIDEFAEQLKERILGMQMVELQGEDVCPCRETGEECPYMNQDIGCQYCAREQTIKDVDKIAEKMKVGATDESTGSD